MRATEVIFVYEVEVSNHKLPIYESFISKFRNAGDGAALGQFQCWRSFAKDSASVQVLCLIY